VCSELLSILKTSDPNLDRFALHFLSSSWDSSNGAAFSLPDEEFLVSAYCSLDDLKVHARQRLEDVDLGYPARAAWQSVVEGKSLYGFDGSQVRR